MPIRARTTHDVSNLSSIQERIRLALAGLQFGTLEIQVHDGRVVRITRTEKVRVDCPDDTSSDDYGA